MLITGQPIVFIFIYESEYAFALVSNYLYINTNAKINPYCHDLLKVLKPKAICIKKLKYHMNN